MGFRRSAFKYETRESENAGVLVGLKSIKITRPESTPRDDKRSMERVEEPQPRSTIKGSGGTSMWGIRFLEDVHHSILLNLRVWVRRGVGRREVKRLEGRMLLVVK